MPNSNRNACLRSVLGYTLKELVATLIPTNPMYSPYISAAEDYRLDKEIDTIDREILVINEDFRALRTRVNKSFVDSLPEGDPKKYWNIFK